MNHDELRRWLSPDPASLPDVDLDLLDPTDEGDRALLIRAQHPEFVSAIDRGEGEIEIGGETVNPQLHLLIHEVVANQLHDDDPPEARETAERLLGEGYDRHEVLHMIASVVTGKLWSALRSDEPIDPADYVAALERLPGDWDAPARTDALRADELDLNNEDDEEAFEEVRDRLLSGHREWLVKRQLDEDDDWAVDQLLQFKWSYVDGHLGRWRIADLSEVLLGLFPRKTSIEDDELPEVVPAVDRFLRYLDDAGLLAADGDPLPRLLEGLESLQEPLLAAVADPANFGMAKSLFAGVGEPDERPVVGELAGASANTMLEQVADWPEDAMDAEVRAWAAGRSNAAEEIAQVAREASAPDLRALAFGALEVIGDEAVQVVRDLVDDPHLRPWARHWLVQLGEEEADTFDPEDAPGAFVQAFAVALLGGGQEAVAEMFADKTPVNEQVELIEMLWRVDDPYTAPVLEALAAAGDKKVAKAARKALFKHRTTSL